MKKKGFTLIELMIVVAIIGILAAIAIPNMAFTKKKAKLASCKSNLDSIGKALDMYADSNNDDYPLETTYGSSIATDSSILITNGYLGKGVTCPVTKADYTYQYSQAKGYTVFCPNPDSHYYSPKKKLTSLYYVSEGGVKTDPPNK